MVVTMALRSSLGLALVLAALPAQADGVKPGDGKIYPAEAAIPNSRVIRFTSAIDKEPYTIQVSIPLWPAPGPAIR